MNPNSNKVIQEIMWMCTYGIEEMDDDSTVATLSGSFDEDGKSTVLIVDTDGFPYRLIIEDATKHGE
jgi:hypothetical protein